MLPLRLAFQELVRRLAPLYCQLAVQPDLLLVPALVTRIAPVKPDPQEWVIT